MKINRAVIPLLCCLPLLLLACHKTKPAVVPGPTYVYSEPVHQGSPGSIQGVTTAQAPAAGWRWLEGCWYWNGQDWEWLAKQWMPPGSQMSYVGPAYSRADYCVYTPPEEQFVATTMLWPPDESYRSYVHVVHHGEFGRRRRPPIRRSRNHYTDHRRPRPHPKPPAHPQPPDWRTPDPVVEVGPAAPPPRVRPQPPRVTGPRPPMGPAAPPSSRPPKPPRPQPPRVVGRPTTPRGPVGPAARPTAPPRPPRVTGRPTTPRGPVGPAKPPSSRPPRHPSVAPKPPRAAPPKRAAPPPRAAPPKRAAPPPRAAPKARPRPAKPAPARRPR